MIGFRRRFDFSSSKHVLAVYVFYKTEILAADHSNLNIFQVCLGTFMVFMRFRCSPSSKH
jgi:hypothetical protein